MNRRQSIGILLGTLASGMVSAGTGLDLGADSGADSGAYLMAHFTDQEQKLFYAYSNDARDWTALNGRKPVFDSGVNLRDPFIGYAKGKYHLVHTKGWDYPVIHHYESTDLINWTGGEVKVVDVDKKRAWAPEWIYDERADLFYVFWASLHNGHNCIHYTTTKDWSDIDPGKAKIYYDIGIDVIDLSIVAAKEGFYGFHKCGSLEDNMGITYMSSPTLNPGDAGFGFGKHGRGTLVTLEGVKPIEGPEIIQLKGMQKWYVYADPFHNDFVAWETEDFLHYRRIAVSVPRGAKHCSIVWIPKVLMDGLLKKYPV